MWLLLHPNAGWVDLTPRFAAYFATSGAVRLFLAAAFGGAAVTRSEWLALSAVLSLNLALVTYSGLPGPYTGALWVALSIDLLVAGVTEFAALAAAHKLPLEERANAAPAPRSFDGRMPAERPEVLFS